MLNQKLPQKNDDIQYHSIVNLQISYSEKCSNIEMQDLFKLEIPINILPLAKNDRTYIFQGHLQQNDRYIDICLLPKVYYIWLLVHGVFIATDDNLSLATVIYWVTSFLYR